LKIRQKVNIRRQYPNPQTKEECIQYLYFANEGVRKAKGKEALAKAYKRQRFYKTQIARFL
jgi:hypothetical protein